MRSNLKRALIAGLVSVCSVASFAAAPPAKSSAKAPAKAPAQHYNTKATTAAADHATTGTVKSVTGSMLVVTRSAKDGGDMTFVLKPSTQREGKIEVGAPVSVRYKEDGKTHIATAVTASPAKAQAAHKTP